MAFNSYKEDEASSNVSKMQTLKRLFSYMKEYKLQVGVVLLILGIGIGISLINPLFIEAAIDKYIAVGNLPGLYKLLGIALAINIVFVALIKLRMYIMAKVCNEILLTIRQELYTHIQTLDFEFFDSRPMGKILSRIIGDINSLKDILSNCVTTLVPDALTVISVAAIMLIKNYKLALSCFVSLPVMALGTMWIEKHAHPNWQSFRKKSSNLNAFLHEYMGGMRVVQTFNAHEETMETFDELVGEHKAAFKSAVLFSDGFFAIIDISWCVGCIFMYYTGIVLLKGEVSVGTFMAFCSYLWSFFFPIQNLSNFYNQIITNIAGAERVFEIMDAQPGIKDIDNPGVMPKIEGEVEFKNVTFSYEDGVKVLDDVSFKINKGETIALVGPTGAGKSTIVNLISRFYDVQQGNVLVDGHDVKKVTIQSLREQMGIMTQDNFLFTGTIKDNIRYGRLDATDEEIIAAAKAVNAHEFIMKLEKGYDTELKERGGGLSIGQKQLLAFARTMVSNPAILILDEATSSIDTKTELLVQEGIEHLLKGRTSFVIAHRLSTIQGADRIFVIDDGKIVEEGNAKELMALKGKYYNLYMSQFAGEKIA